MLNHTAHALLPVRLAALLQADPQLVAAITGAFYYRDVDAMAAFARHAALGVPASVDDMVTVAVRCNRVHYAQLAMQRFEPPKVVRAVLPGCTTMWYWSSVFSCVTTTYTPPMTTIPTYLPPYYTALPNAKHIILVL